MCLACVCMCVCVLNKRIEGTANERLPGRARLYSSHRAQTVCEKSVLQETLMSVRKRAGMERRDPCPPSFRPHIPSR